MNKDVPHRTVTSTVLRHEGKCLSASQPSPSHRSRSTSKSQSSQFVLCTITTQQKSLDPITPLLRTGHKSNHHIFNCQSMQTNGYTIHAKYTSQKFHHMQKKNPFTKLMRSLFFLNHQVAGIKIPCPCSPLATGQRCTPDPKQPCRRPLTA